MLKVDKADLSSKTFVSTGKFYHQDILDTVSKFIQAGHTRLEISCGQVQPSDIAKLKKLHKIGIQFRLHNYFPVFGDHFVLNLSSANHQLRERSRQHVFTAINWSSELESRFFAVHAGFRLSPRADELGKVINSGKLTPLSDAKNIFLDELNIISNYAEKYGVTLLVENNVYSRNNYQHFKNDNPFLFCGDQQSMLSFPDSVGLLIDLAHLKVSGNTLGFELSETLKSLSPQTMGYHYSDNNGTSDTNDHIRDDSYLLKLQLKSVEYHTVEVYDEDLESLHSDVKQLQKCSFTPNEFIED